MVEVAVLNRCLFEIIFNDNFISTMLSTVCASYVVNARSPQNAFISFEAQHKIERAPAARVSRQLLLFYLLFNVEGHK